MTDSRRNLLKRIETVVHNLVLDDSLVITEETKLTDLAEWDSLLHVTLVIALETEFDVRLDDKEASQSTAIRPILDLLEAKAGQASGAAPAEDAGWKR